jgi:hypothetical protein
VLKNYYLEQRIKASYIQKDRQGLLEIIPDNKYGIDPENKPDQEFSMTQVRECLRVRKRAEKKKEDYVKHNSKKNGEGVGDPRFIMSLLEKAYEDAKLAKKHAIGEEDGSGLVNKR